MFSRNQGRHLVLVTGLLLGALTPAHAAADDDSADRSLIVTQGTGEVRVRPDSVRVDVGFTAQSATLDEARRQVDTAMTHVVDALHRLGIPDLTLETSQIRYNPVYGTPSDGHAPVIEGFSADNHVTVSLKGVPQDTLADQGARILDAALDAGANEVGSINFFLADPSKAEDEALRRAVQNAADDARTMADAAGVTLVGPVSIEEGSAARVPRAFAMMAPAMSTPIEVGEMTIQSTVTARFSFR